MPTPNPLRIDPSRTLTLRNRFLADVTRRFAKIASALNELIVPEDALGLKERVLGLQLNTRWEFKTSDAKVEAFKQWFQEQVDQNLLTVDNNTTEPWSSTYVHSAYKKGLMRSYVDANKKRLIGRQPGFLNASKEDFLRSSFTQPEAVSKLKLISTRTYDQLKNMTSQMATDMSRVLADGLSKGLGPKDVARDLTKALGISKNRAKAIARTEIIHAHSEGQLDSLERLGVAEVGVMVEWQISSGACPLCQSLAGIVLTIKQARGLIPRHTNCRCAFVPANVGESTKGQLRSKTAIGKAILASVKKEHPKSRTPKADSRWKGADVRIPKRQGASR